MTQELYIGLMSGTSLDAIDAALVSFDDERTQLVATHEHEFPQALKFQLGELIASAEVESLDRIGELNRTLGETYAQAADALLEQADCAKENVIAIGCHGQTVRHQPDSDAAFTWQLGDAAVVAARTSIATVADFRSMDIALGGQGAPLAPAFHDFAFREAGEQRIIVNLGGISNLTLLTDTDPVIGFDAGPANTLLDIWCEQHIGKPYDENGDWARQGDIYVDFLATLLTDSYFSLPAPKSTGREYFNLAWLDRYTSGFADAPAGVDMQATLTELTAATVAEGCRTMSPGATVFLCGGGAHNGYLRERVAAALPDSRVATTAELGVEPEWVEAAAFAWLARARLRSQTGSVATVTGASRPAILGAIYAP